MAWDRARTAKWFGISVLITIVGSVILWNVFPGAIFGFLFLPFLPFAFGRRGRSNEAPPAQARLRTCPRCGYVGLDPQDRFCPRDGSELR